jgi:hypothetical protein
MVAMDRLLIAIGKQDERYGSERYGDQRSEGGAKIGLPVVGCVVVRHRDLRLSALCRQRLHRIEVPASVAARRNPALSRTQAPSPRCCDAGEVKDWQLVEQHGLWWS